MAFDPDSDNNQINPIVLFKTSFESVDIVVAFAYYQKYGMVRPLLIEYMLLLNLLLFRELRVYIIWVSQFDLRFQLGFIESL